MVEQMRRGILTLPVEDTVRGLNEATTPEEREFVESIYDLFTQFRDAHRDVLDEIRKARAMRELKDEAASALDPQLNTLNSTIDNLVADFMDNLPEAVMLPENPEQQPLADQMTDVVAWILHHAGFKEYWARAIEDATTTGTAVLEAFYDDSMDVAGRRGGIGIQSWRPEAWLPDPLYENPQEGRAIFKVCTHPLSYFYQHYPEKAHFIAADASEVLGYMQIDRLNDVYSYNDPSVCLIEAWYRRYDPKTKRFAVHMAKVAGRVLLYDSREDNPNGVYRHGMYPFVVLRFRERRGNPYGTGMCYEYADTQRMINSYVRYIDENARASSKPKLLVAKDAGISASDLADYDKQVLLAERVDKEFANWFQAAPLNSLIPTMVARLQDMMKQDSGQNQFSRGEGGLGVTAASAIAALQEAGGKIVRMHTSNFMEAFREMCQQVISLAGEFMDEPMVLMIHGQDGGMPPKQIAFDGRTLTNPNDPYLRPAMYVRVEVQKTNPNQIQAKNQLLLQIAQIAQATSPIPPAMLVRALSMTGKEDIVKLLEDTDQQKQILMQLQQAVEQLAAENQQLKEALDTVTQDAMDKTNLIKAVAGQMGQPAPSMPPLMQQQMQAQQGQNVDYSTLTSA
jgi:hypothetical protein